MSRSPNSPLQKDVTLLPNWQDVAVETKAAKLSVAAACREAGITRQTFYNY